VKAGNGTKTHYRGELDIVVPHPTSIGTDSENESESSLRRISFKKTRTEEPASFWSVVPVVVASTSQLIAGPTNREIFLGLNGYRVSRVAYWRVEGPIVSALLDLHDTKRKHENRKTITSGSVQPFEETPDIMNEHERQLQSVL
jgi:hypothetical protein